MWLSLLILWRRHDRSLHSLTDFEMILIPRVALSNLPTWSIIFTSLWWMQRSILKVILTLIVIVLGDTLRWTVKLISLQFKSLFSIAFNFIWVRVLLFFFNLLLPDLIGPLILLVVKWFDVAVICTLLNDFIRSLRYREHTPNVFTSFSRIWLDLRLRFSYLALLVSSWLLVGKISSSRSIILIRLAAQYWVTTAHTLWCLFTFSRLNSIFGVLSWYLLTVMELCFRLTAFPLGLLFDQHFATIIIYWFHFLFLRITLHYNLALHLILGRGTLVWPFDALGSVSRQDFGLIVYLILSVFKS